jgi:hypothetical protein
MKTMIKDSYGKFIGTSELQGHRTVIKEWGTGKIVAIYDPNTDTTLTFPDNRTTKGNVAMLGLR